MSLRLRLAVLVGALALGLVAAAGVSFDAYLASATRATLTRALRQRSGRVRAELAGGLLLLSPLGEPPRESADQALIQVAMSSGSLRYTSATAGPRPLLDAAQLDAAERRTLLFQKDEPGWRNAHLLMAGPVRGARGEVLVVGTSLDQVNDSLAQVHYGLLVGGALAVLIVGWGTWLLAGAALRPVEGLRAEAARLAAGPSDEDLAVPTTNDELAALASTLNALLGRVRVAVAHQRRFVAIASHELRTPLAGIRAELELAARPGRPRGEVDAALVRLEGRAVHLSKVCDGLLLLARADSATLTIQRERCLIEPVVTEALVSVTGRAAAAGVDVVLDADSTLVAEIDRVRFREVVDDLVDNALRHSPAGSAIVVSVRSSGNDGVLEVRDHGPGFDVDFLPRAFEPFARPGAEPLRPGAGAGSGLGLAIVRLITSAHGGTARVGNHPEGGAVVVVSFPLCAPEAGTSPAASPENASEEEPDATPHARSAQAGARRRAAVLRRGRAPAT